MKFEFRRVELVKRYPLTISRGTSATSQSLYVGAIGDDGVVGWGECAPGTGHGDDFADQAVGLLTEFVHQVDEVHNKADIARLWDLAMCARLPAPAIAGLDIALWDLMARRQGRPLWALLDEGRSPEMVPSSLTIGINPTEVVRERSAEILQRTGAKALKVKLGSPEGVEHDRANYLAARESASRFGAKLRVDANGGWTVDDARAMMVWLSERDCEYVEQPLPRGSEGDLRYLFEDRPLPIFADESCHFAQDVAPLADRVDGVNLKLMKCGGITEALLILEAARLNGLKTMIGCMSESSIAISAGAALGPKMDFIDLDSNLNLIDEPATRDMEWRDGAWDLSTVTAGHGASPRES